MQSGGSSMLASRVLSSLFAVSVLACSGETAGIPDAASDGSPGVDGGGLACVGGTTACGDKCIELDVDPKNCGACGKACAAGEMCSAGKCATFCQTGYMACNGNA